MHPEQAPCLSVPAISHEQNCCASMVLPRSLFPGFLLSCLYLPWNNWGIFWGSVLQKEALIGTGKLDASWYPRVRTLYTSFPSMVLFRTFKNANWESDLLSEMRYKHHHITQYKLHRMERSFPINAWVFKDTQIRQKSGGGRLQEAWINPYPVKIHWSG